MYIPTFLVVILGILFFWLWSKVSALEKKHQLSEYSPKLTLRPKNEFYDLPLIRELVGVDSKEKDKEFKDLSEKEKAKVRKFVKEKWDQLHLNFRFFYDRELVYSQGYFADMPSKNDFLYSVSLGEDNEGNSTNFNIKLRYIDGVVKDKSIGVYTGYLKKETLLSDSDKEGEMTVVFELPEFFVNPNFYDLQKSMPELKEELEKKFGLSIKDDDSFGDYTNDFGEKEYFTGFGARHQNKYFEFIY